MNEHHCFKCGKIIKECMGFVLARDFLNDSKNPRELCGKCILLIIDDSSVINLLKNSYE
jgi:hypothetical protein